MRFSRRLGVGLMLAAAGMTTAAIMLELFLRLTGYHQAFAQPDAVIGYVLAPRFSRTVPVLEYAGGSAVFRTNNLGLRRDTDTAISKPPNTERVLVLGDSQTEGIVPNNESYCSDLERTLNDTPHQADDIGTPRIEVLNAAVSGYSPLLEYLWLRERGRPLQPDVIVVALYTGNDVGELLMHYEDFGGLGPSFILPFLQRADGGWRIMPPGSESGAFGRLDWVLQTQLRSYAALRRRFSVRGSPAAGDAAVQRVLHRSPGCLQAVWQALVAHGDVTGLRDGFERLDYLLGELQREARTLNAHLLVAVVPSKLEVEELENAAPVQETLNTLGLRYDITGFNAAVRERIVALATEHGIETVDLLPALQQWHREHQRPLYWDLDWHLNVDGHRVVAQQLMPTVSRILHIENAGHAN